MSTQVVATAGHVDHGKSTLIRALTGVEPDRWAEEKRRGLTIDLGFAGMTTARGTQVDFVDVPGHERFLGNTLAGLGASPMVCFVVAADEGWRAQSGDHRDAIAALGIDRGLIVVTRSDLASPDRQREVIAQARHELRTTGLAEAPAVVVSARTGDGLTELRKTLDELVEGTPGPDLDSRLRLWLDRAFSIRGAGTVVTGTLASGRITVSESLLLTTESGQRQVTVRGLQRHGQDEQTARPVSRVAVNLRGVAADEVSRGDALLSPGAWWFSEVLDVELVAGRDLTEVPEHVALHVGTASSTARVRALGPRHARLTLPRAYPLSFGDRMVLRSPGDGSVLGGVQVLDPDPPALTRRGDARRRADALTAMGGAPDPVAEIRRRGAVVGADLVRRGVAGPAAPSGVRTIGPWWVDPGQFETWRASLREVVEAEQRSNPLAGGLTDSAAADLIGLPATTLLAELAADAGLARVRGRVALPDGGSDFGDAASAVDTLTDRLATQPFSAPEAGELEDLGIDARVLAAAEREGRIIRLDGGVVLLPNAPALAMRELAALPALFTTAEARRALDTTRRVVIPLLEHLDARGWTRRVDPQHRSIVR